MQGDLKDYFSQRYRNLRRYSEQTDTSKSDTKIITKEKAVPMAQTHVHECLDEVGYLRSMESLLKEVKRPQPRDEIVKKLLEVTFEGRRQKIDGALVQTTTLLDEYPFFKIKKWVSILIHFSIALVHLLNHGFDI